MHKQHTHSHTTRIHINTDKQHTQHTHTLQKLKYDIHTKLPLESYQIQFWYDSGSTKCLGQLV